MDYESAISTLESLYVKPKNEIFARHVLSSTKQDGQTLDQFLQKLKSLSKECNFRAVTAEQARDDAIRDAFISGIDSNQIRQRLLEQKSLDLQSAYETARSLELAQHHAQTYEHSLTTQCASFTQPNPSVSVSTTSLTDLNISAVTSACFFCGYKRHPRSQCPAREAICKTCGKKGHFHKVCKSATLRKPIPHLPVSSISSITLAASPGGLSNAVTNIMVNDVPLQALIDTGSTESYISQTAVIVHNFKVEQSQTIISMASTHLTARTLGHCNVSIKHKNSYYPCVKLSVLSSLCADVLLGHDFLKQHSSLHIPFEGDKPQFSICALAAARVDPPSLFSHLSPSCKPVTTKSRRYSVTERLFIESEVRRLLDEDIIETSDSPWRAQVLVTSNERHKRRMVIDYSQTINQFTYLDAYPVPRIDELIEKISTYEVYSTLDLRSAYHQIPMIDDEKKFTAFEACGQLYQFKRIPFGVTNGVACFQRVMNNIISKQKLSDTYAYVDNVIICGRNKDQHDDNLTKFLDVARTHNITFNNDKSIIGTHTIQLLGYEVTHGQIRPDPERFRALRELPHPHDRKSQLRAVGMFSYYSPWITHFSDKIHSLAHNTQFPLPSEVKQSFEALKQELEKAVLVTPDPKALLTVETDASDIAIAATLNQNGRPVAFFSRTLNNSEKNHSAIEKEAYAVVEALRKWRHYLIGRHFTIVTDQKSVAFMYNRKHKGKVKNDKIQRWRIELSCFQFDIVYRPGQKNVAPDAFSRFCSGMKHGIVHLEELHASLCHPGITRMMHFIRAKNLPYSLEEVKSLISRCKVCAELKPTFYNPQTNNLIKATQPFERLSIDFKGPIPSHSSNKYLLTIIDEFSRFPFAYPCSDMSTSTVI
ncbi:MAG: RNase H-like domain-containing protein, partial [Lactococcus garvieae]